MILVVGSLNMDLVVNTSRIPVCGETVLGKNFAQISGGKGGNQADAIAKLGATVHMIGKVGTDDFGSRLKESLQADGVNVEAVFATDAAATGVAAILVDEKGNNCITVASGANFELTKEDLVAHKGLFDEAQILLLQLEVPMETVVESLIMAKDAGKTTILNPAPAAHLADDVWETIDIITPNETELAFLTGLPTGSVEEAEIAAKTLLAKGVAQVLVTLGGNGALLVSQNGTKHWSSHKVEAVDTTAAGDSFNGALTVALEEGKTVEEAVEFAMAVGALTVTRAGAQSSLPLRAEVEEFIKNLK